MKTYIFLFSILIITLCSTFTAKAELHKNTDPKHEVACSVSDFVVTPASEFCDGEILTLNFSFTSTDFGLNGYRFGVVGGWTYTYMLGDPQIFDYIALCDEPETFFIYDIDNPDCMTTFEYGFICCQCEIDIEITQGECVGGFSSAIIDLLETSGSCTNHYPTLTINGESYPMVYSRPLGNYPISNIDSFEDSLTYVICTNVPGLNECFTFVIANPCFIPVFNFEATLNEELCANGYMEVFFSFQGSGGFGANGFVITTNTGFSQFFNLEDPYVLYLPADCSENIILTISDYNNSSLSANFVLGTVCCPCDLNYNLVLSNCENGSMDVNVFILDSDGSCSYHDWDLTVNEDELLLTEVNGNYFYYGFTSQDSLLNFNLCSQVPGLTECFESSLVNPCYQVIADTCTISGFTLTSDTTSCEHEFITFNFGYNATGFGANGYNISTNTGFSQFYNANDTTLLTLIADCNENIIVAITDANDSLCTAVDTVGVLCCPCVPSFSVSTSTCVNDSFNLSIIIDSLSGSCINYEWSLTVNGQTYDLVADSLGYSVTGIQSSDSLIVYELCSLVPGLSECFGDTLANPCYQITEDSCTISGFTLTSDSTSCEDEIITFNFGYIATGFGSNGYNISTNTGFNQFYNTNDTTLLTLIADCNENIIVTITDANDSLCTTVDTVGVLCCPCEPSFSVSTSTCVNDSFSLSIVIDSLSGSCINYEWRLTINGQVYDLVVDSLGYSVSGIQSSDSLIIYELCSLVPGLSECFGDTLANPCYQITVDSCSITAFSVTVDTLSCSEDFIDVNFEYSAIGFGTNGYTITSNNGFSQNYNLGDNNVMSIFADCIENSIFTITDGLDSLCTYVDTFGIICCPCEPSFLFTQESCVDDMFNVVINLDNVYGICKGFGWSLEINGEFITSEDFTALNINGITSSDSLIVYKLCSLKPGSSGCFTYVLVNPCFDGTVSVGDEHGIEYLVQINFMQGNQIMLQSKFGQNINVQIYNVNGQLMNFIPEIQPYQSILMDISTWNSGMFFVKISSELRTSTLKFFNVR